MATQGPTHRIGELAEASGLSVRALRHYEEIGLLVPAQRSEAGHRLYGTGEVERLYRICSLRQLGLPLDGIRRSLADDGVELQSTITDHLADLDRRLAMENRLRAKLAHLVANFEPGGAHGQAVIDVLEDMSMLDTLIDRPIATLVYRDICAAFDHLTGVLGLGPGELTTTPEGDIVHGEIEVGSGTVWLHPESSDYGLSSPDTLGPATATMVVIVDDVDEHHRAAVERGAVVTYPPVDQPYGYREYAAADSEGHLWSFMKPL